MLVKLLLNGEEWTTYTQLNDKVKTAKWDE